LIIFFTLSKGLSLAVARSLVSSFDFVSFARADKKDTSFLRIGSSADARNIEKELRLLLLFIWTNCGKYVSPAPETSSLEMISMAL
jgi:hypothetical protein